MISTTERLTLKAGNANTKIDTLRKIRIPFEILPKVSHRTQKFDRKPRTEKSKNACLKTFELISKITATSSEND